MGLKHHTIIIVPHARAKLRKVRVTNLQLGVALATFVFLTFAATFVIWAHLNTSLDREDLERLRQENVQLRETNQSFEVDIRKLQQQLSDYEDRTRKLAIVAGLENLTEGNEAGIGGDPFPEEIFDGTPDLAALATRAERVGVDLDRIEAQLDEQLRWISATPAIIPVKGLLTSGFGYRRDPITGRRALHQAIDIAAAPGQPVRASADGVVIRAGRLSGLGNAVYLGHGYGISTRYGHLARIEVKPGQRVKRGDILGRVGNTGRSTGYHLHYEVRVDGKPVNPLAYILDYPPGRS